MGRGIYVNIEGVEPVLGYVYRDNGVELEPQYEALFYGIKPQRPFKKWIVAGTTYTAEYQGTNLAEPNDLERLAD